ncbi:MAG: alpha-2-macroglobulin [Planctomycetaceae bacterium]|nr:alpha-2-macroglobulin [Planctomycetaceae bacterium]
MKLTKNCFLFSFAAVAFVFCLTGAVFAQALPGGRTIARPAATPTVPPATRPSPSDLPNEINMKNPIPDCEKYINAGLYKEAFDALKIWTLDSQADSQTVGQGFQLAIQCLLHLNRFAEMDNYRDSVIAVHRKNWRLLKAAAISSLASNGSIIDGTFVRGNNKGEQVVSQERDHVQNLLLLKEATTLALQDDNKKDVAEFFLDFAARFCNSSEGWKMQLLTDLSGTLPDYEKAEHYYGERYNGRTYAPVDADGNPIYYDVPKSFEAAKNDGERWRWCLEMAVENDPSWLENVLQTRAVFAESQFGTSTLSDYQSFFNAAEDTTEREAGIFALHTLDDSETIAKLANGVKRFKLRDDYNYISLYKQMSEAKADHWKEVALKDLAQSYANRRQFDTAAKYWQQLIDQFPNEKKAIVNGWKNNLNQILGNWGRFEPVQAAAHGKATELNYVFRNGKSVTLTATEIKIPRLIDDIKVYIRTKPQRLDWEKISVEQIGYRLVINDMKTGDAGIYLGKEVAKWTVPLKPAARHFDVRTTLTTPMTTGGAYLVKAEMENGNTEYIVVWVNDTAIVRKTLDKKIWFYFGDAQTGSPVTNANVNAFGYWQEHKGGNNFTFHIDEKNFQSDAQGQLTLDDSRLNSRGYQWLITATTKDGRFAFSGFNGIWYSRFSDQEYNQTKAFFISDRPVYRPGDQVEYKFWIGTAKYDQPYDLPLAGQKILLEIISPRGDRLLQKIVQLDAYGGIAEKLDLPKDATLGIWSAVIGTPNTQSDGTYQFRNYYGNGSFRVEEYKKPEYEVTIDAPKEPVTLGEKVSAKISAKYYFGSPVTNAKVKYKVLRTKHNADWYPLRPWDWFYGNGYWWFGYDYDWYPGWRNWGCCRPLVLWLPRGDEQPEIVAEQETEIGEDGTVDVTFDTAFTKEMFPNDNQKYEITAEVVDQSRRTIVGKGNVLVAKEPFKVYAWTNRGYYQTGEQIRTDFQARCIDGKPVTGKGTVKLYQITYKQPDQNSMAEPTESLVHTENIDLNELGTGHATLSAAQTGQYRVSCSVTDATGHMQEGGSVFSVRGSGQSNATFRFNELEIIPNKAEFAPGENVELLVNTNRPNSTVLLFVKPANGVYLPPQLLKIAGQSTTVTIPVTQRDMPNFFIEAVTISDGKSLTEAKELAVPPVKRILNVEVRPNNNTYKPGEKASVALVVTDLDGKPVVGQNVVAIYDKSVEYISGGSNVEDIKEFFWKWRRNHHPHTESNLQHYSNNLPQPNQPPMETLGLFGNYAGQTASHFSRYGGDNRSMMLGGVMMKSARVLNQLMDMEVNAEPMADANMVVETMNAKDDGALNETEQEPLIEAALRKDFADTAFWGGVIETNNDGIAQVELNMPENLTTWKVNVWSMAAGTQVGYATTDVITRKDLMIRMQTPRFLTQTDQILLTANVHNYLSSEKKVQVSLELDGKQLESKQNDLVKNVTISANGESRVDWLVEAKEAGDAIVRMKALTNEESDAMQMAFPVQVHGMLKQETFSGAIRPNDSSEKVTVNVPAARIAEQSRLTVRFSPTLAGTMIDALPYLADYPYGCTEQTLNRFLPTVITQKILLDSGVDLAALEQSHANLNAQELGDPQQRVKQWKREKYSESNPAYSIDEVQKMVNDGVKRLTEMQLSDGGWGWFSGYGEHSSAHLTAQVIRGLLIAQQNDVKVDKTTIERGLAWLKNYQDKQLQLLKNAELPEEQRQKMEWKQYADDIDAFVAMVLQDAIPVLGKKLIMGWETKIGQYLWRDKAKLSLYGVAMVGMFSERAGKPEETQLCLRMLEQYLEQDGENQTAWLNLNRTENWCWWRWYGSEFETQAMYLKLLTRVKPKSDVAPRLVKWLLNNRKHATYWNSTRDTALCVEAFADYLRATGESKPNMTVEILLDGKVTKTTEITPENMLTIDNTFVLEGTDVPDGTHEIEIRRKGTGAVYFNAYLENFTLENPISATGLEVRVQRRYWLLTPADKSKNAVGKEGQVVSQKVEKYEKTPIVNLAKVKSGQLVEIELIIESKNDYESLMIEDMKPAGFEPVEVRSGYNGNSLGAYVEYRDNRVTFFVHRLSQGTHNVRYQMRAEQPGTFSALPAKIEAMYAPELKGNSDEWKVNVVD